MPWRECFARIASWRFVDASMLIEPSKPSSSSAPGARPADRRRHCGRAVARGQWLAIVVLGLTGVAAFGIAPDTALETVPIATSSNARCRFRNSPRRPRRHRDVLARGARPARRYDRQPARARRASTIPTPCSSCACDPAARPLYQLRPGRPVHVAVDDDGRPAGAARSSRATGEHARDRRAHDGGFHAAQQSGRRGSAHHAAHRARSAARCSARPTRPACRTGDHARARRRLRRRHRLLPRPAARRSLHGALRNALRRRRGRRHRPHPRRRVRQRRQTHARLPVARRRRQRAATTPTTAAARASAFLRSPMEFSRITSGFSLARFHPILQTWRAHKGVDYAAPDRARRCGPPPTASSRSPAGRAATATSSSFATTAATRRSTATCRDSPPA